MPPTAGPECCRKSPHWKICKIQFLFQQKISKNSAETLIYLGGAGQDSSQHRAVPSCPPRANNLFVSFVLLLLVVSAHAGHPGQQVEPLQLLPAEEAVGRLGQRADEAAGDAGPAAGPLPVAEAGPAAEATPAPPAAEGLASHPGKRLTCNDTAQAGTHSSRQIPHLARLAAVATTPLCSSLNTFTP